MVLLDFHNEKTWCVLNKIFANLKVCVLFFLSRSCLFFSQNRSWPSNKIISSFFFCFHQPPKCRFCRQSLVFWEQPDNFIACWLHTAWDWRRSSAMGVSSSSLILEMLTRSASLKTTAIKDTFFSLKDTENRRDQHSLLKGPSGPILCLYKMQNFFQKVD